MRDLILAIDVLLSYGIRLIVFGAFLRLIFFRKVHAPWLNELLIILLVAAYLLLRLERAERIKHLLRPFYIDDINVGSARMLKGNVMIGHIFLDNLGDSWSEKRIQGVWEKASEATSWLEQQAATYNIQVRIVNKLLEDKICFDKAIPTHQNHFEFKRELEAALQPAFKRLADYVNTSTEKPDNYCLLVHAPVSIRSYAVPARIWIKDAEKKIEYCLCAAHLGSGGYAHELLHLFGADDFYAEFYKKLQNYRHEFLKGSIMFSCEFSEDTRIDPLTAQNIGWL